MTVPARAEPRPPKVSFNRFHGLRLLQFQQWCRDHYQFPPRDAAQSDARYKRWLLSFS